MKLSIEEEVANLLVDAAKKDIKITDLELETSKYDTLTQDLRRYPGKCLVFNGPMGTVYIKEMK